MTWIFAYGSLIWNWEHPYTDRTEAVLQGYHREFNKKSIVHWGTRNSPAPVLGLETGGDCRGIAYRIPPENSDAVVAKLKKREGSGYEKRTEEIQLANGRREEALVWVNNTSHSTYIGDIPLEERAEMTIDAEGQKGTGIEYVESTWRDLEESGIEDPSVQNFYEIVQSLRD